MDSSDEEYTARMNACTHAFIHNLPVPERKRVNEKKETPKIQPPKDIPPPKKPLPPSFGGPRIVDPVKRCQEIGLPMKFGGEPRPSRNPGLPRKFGGVPIKKPEDSGFPTENQGMSNEKSMPRPPRPSERKEIPYPPRSIFPPPPQEDPPIPRVRSIFEVPIPRPRLVDQAVQVDPVIIQVKSSESIESGFRSVESQRSSRIPYRPVESPPGSTIQNPAPPPPPPPPRSSEWQQLPPSHPYRYEPPRQPHRNNSNGDSAAPNPIPRGGDQTPWTTNRPTLNDSINNDSDDGTIHPTPDGYPDMFTELRQKLAREERKPPLLLPPLAKGKITEKIMPRRFMEENSEDRILRSYTSEALEQMSEEELQEVTNKFYESAPIWKFKPDFPFMAEGIVQKDSETGQLKVYSARLGKVMMEDTRDVKTSNYVYFMAIKPGVNGGCYFDIQPPCLISAKFPSVDRIVLRGFAILAHPVGTREESLKEGRWICWNDSLGLMAIISGAARTPLKKQPVWDKQLDVISIHANFENRRFVVTKVVALTNSKDKKDHFPHEVFLVKDAIFRRQYEDDLIFYSATIKADIYIKKTLVGEAQIFENHQFEMVVVPSFPRSQCLEFRSLLIIQMPTIFWSKDKEWIREKLVNRMESYRRR